MANSKNIEPYKFNEMCSEAAAKIQSKGGKAKAKKIKEQKQFEAFQLSAQKALYGSQGGRFHVEVHD